MDKIKINCGDHKIELTQQELRSIYEYKDREYLVEDIKSEIEDMKFSEQVMEKLSSQYEEIAELAKDNLENNDDFWDIYWSQIRTAIVKKYIGE